MSLIYNPHVFFVYLLFIFCYLLYLFDTPHIIVKVYDVNQVMITLAILMSLHVILLY